MYIGKGVKEGDLITLIPFNLVKEKMRKQKLQLKQMI